METALTVESEVAPNHDSELQTIRNRVVKGLSGDETFLGIEQETRERIFDVLASTTMELSKLLEVPEVHFAFKPPDEKKDGVYASSGLIWTKKYGGGYKIGLVTFDPDYLVSIAKDISEPITGEWNEDFLRWTTAHELYHIREAVLFPKRFERTGRMAYETSEATTTQIWISSDRADYAAELFALTYLKSRTTEGWMDKIGKAINYFIMGRHVRGLKQMRHSEASES